MSFTEKIDVLELLINVLTEHEEKLDELISRLEGAPTARLQVDAREYFRWRREL
ncbi:unnamed protein product [marine sediment metagenome]|uniref:Uncharacterized protein n=1 Tax=marine sediment metagenome TaxID=412755 RepID=X1IXG0_9ZZZZ